MTMFCSSSTRRTRTSSFQVSLVARAAATPRGIDTAETVPEPVPEGQIIDTPEDEPIDTPPQSDAGLQPRPNRRRIADEEHGRL